RRRHTRWPRDWSSDVCSSDLRSTERRVSDRAPIFFLTRAMSFATGGPSTHLECAALRFPENLGPRFDEIAVPGDSCVERELSCRSEERRVGKECRSRCGGER